MHVSACFSAGATKAADVIMVSVLALVGSLSESEKHFKAALGERGTSGELLINALEYFGRLATAGMGHHTSRFSVWVMGLIVAH